MRFRLRLLLIVAISCLPAALLAAQVTLYLNRPLFADVFGRREFFFFAEWQPNLGIVFDRQGTGIKIDRPLNIVVVFREFYTPKDYFWQMDFAKSFRSTSTETWNDTTASSEDGVEYVIPRRANRLFVFERDGTRRELVIPPGKADRCYEAFFVNGAEGTGDILETLKSLGIQIIGN